MIAGGEYTDFIVGSSGSTTLIDAGALIPIDQYWDNYPNVKNFYSDAEWNQIRNADGHVYIIPQFGNVYMYDTTLQWRTALPTSAMRSSQMTGDISALRMLPSSLTVIPTTAAA